MIELLKGEATYIIREVIYKEEVGIYDSRIDWIVV